MPFLRPSLTALQSQAISDVAAANLPGVGGLLNRAILRILAYVQSQMAWLHYGYLDWIAKQAVPFTATDEFLESWAALKGVVRIAATPATGTVTLTGIDGSTIPSGTIVQRVDGAQYVLTTGGTVNSGTAKVAVTAVVAGAAGNTDAGVSLTLTSPVTGCNSAATTAGPLVGGADQETDDALRTRMLQVYAQPPQGGSLQDYLDWALAVPGVTRAWAKAGGAGVGSVTLWIMLDVSEAAHAGYPQGSNGGAALETRIGVASGDQLLVANALYPLRPATALLYVAAPTPYPIAVNITALSPDTSAIQSLITSSLTELFNRIGSPTGGTVYPSDISSAIASVPGVTRFALNSPNGPIALPTGSLPTLGTLTFSA